MRTTRRHLLQIVAALAPTAFVRARAVRAAAAQLPPTLTPLDQAVLPRGIRARFVDNVNGIRMHVLEAGTPGAGAGGAGRAVLLVHGFPELAYSWRKVMLPLAAAGFHVIAPDLRG